jgi:hypothetical protein
MIAGGPHGIFGGNDTADNHYDGTQQRDSDPVDDKAGDSSHGICQVKAIRNLTGFGLGVGPRINSC